MERLEALREMVKTWEHEKERAVDVPVSRLRAWYDAHFNNVLDGNDTRPCLDSCKRCQVEKFLDARVVERHTQET